MSAGSTSRLTHGVDLPELKTHMTSTQALNVIGMGAETLRMHVLHGLIPAERFGLTRLYAIKVEDVIEAQRRLRKRGTPRSEWGSIRAVFNDVLDLPRLEGWTTPSEMSLAMGCSRQHVAQKYINPKDPANRIPGLHRLAASILVPQDEADAVIESFRRGD